MLRKFNLYLEGMFGIEWGRRDDDFKPRKDVLKKSLTAYGFWLLPNGRLVDVPLMAHVDVGMEIYKNVTGEDLTKEMKWRYFPFFNKGWVRIYNDRFDEVLRCEYLLELTKQQKNALEDLQMNYHINKIIMSRINKNDYDWEDE